MKWLGNLIWEFDAASGGLIHLEDDASIHRHQYRHDNSCHRLWASQALSNAGNPCSGPREMLDKETQMKRMLRLTVALLLGAAVISPILGAGQANACHYTSQDRAKGYKC
jgi:hypothetical protein